MLSIAEIFLILGGITLAIGIITLILGLSKYGEDAYLWFGLFSIFSTIFSFLEGVSYLSEDPGSFATRFWILFAGAYFIFFVWFIGAYTDFRKFYLQVVLSAMLATVVLVYFLQPATNLWDILAHIVIMALSMYGLIAGLKGRYPAGKIWKWLFIFFMLILMALNVNSALHNLLKVGGITFNNGQPIPLDVFPILFVLVMGYKMINDIFKKYQLEHQLIARENRWQGLMDNIEVVIVEINMQGSVLYINPAFSRMTGYEPAEVLHRDWFSTMFPESKKDDVYAAFSRIVAEDDRSELRNNIITKDGRSIALLWKNVIVQDSEHEGSTMLSIGMDITALEEARMEVEQLKNELEKENLLLRKELKGHVSHGIIGESSAIQYTVQRCLQVAKTDSSVLLEGETGAGKELIADLIHRQSKRAGRPFVKVNCAALPKELIESELFGHEKGSFTGAHKSRRGRFETADGGTIFLDEIGELPIELQPRLLRVLQDGTFEPVGSDDTKNVDVRLIAATNRDLEERVRSGHFREDLYYRLNVYPITVPPLRQRKEDIPLLVGHFVKTIGERIGKEILNISKADIKKLEAYHWPGNVRELENIIERAIIQSNGDTLHLELPDYALANDGDSRQADNNHSMSEQQRQLIIDALVKCDWKINGKDGTATFLDMHPSTLRSKMKKLNIRRPE